MIFNKLIPAFLTFSLMFASIYCEGQETDYSLAKVGIKIYGVYIFIGAEPYHEYEYVATIDVKVSWTGTQRESFEKAINKAKKKYPYFNGMMFHSNNFDRVDLIRFKGLGVSRGGISIGAMVSFIDKNRVNYGTVVELESERGSASVKYFNIFEEEKVKKLLYTELTPLSNEEFLQKKKEFKIETEKYKYNIREKVTWIENNELSFGEIISLNNKYHQATVKYLNIFGEEKIKITSFTELTKLTEEDYLVRLKELEEEIASHKFNIDEKVSWISSGLGANNDKQMTGIVVELNDTFHKASVKYIDEDNEEKIVKIKYLKLMKIIE